MRRLLEHPARTPRDKKYTTNEKAKKEAEKREKGEETERKRGGTLTGNRAFPFSNQNVMCPLVCPGVSSTTASDAPTATLSPSETLTPIRGMRPASHAAPTTVAPNRSASSSLPPTWSPWWCVFRMRSSLPPSRASTKALTGAASAGSTTATVPVASSTSTQA